MPFKAENNNAGNFEPLAAGTYAARLFSLVHIGRVPITWEGQTKILDKVRLTFEFPTETKVFKEENGEQPYVMSTEFTYNTFSSKGKLRPFLEGWAGRKFTDSEAMDIDLENWIGKEGLANVVHSEYKNSTYANIQTMSPLPKGMECPPQVNPTFLLNFHEHWSEEKLKSLPEFLRTRIMSSDNFILKVKNSDNQEPAEEEINLEDIPF